MSLSNSIWWTRKARIQAEKRLLANAFQSQVILLWYSFFAVCVSVYYLKNSQDETQAIAWVLYSVLILCLSVFINGLSFKERAALIKECYESLTSILIKARDKDSDKSTLSKEYESKLNACENHTDNDFAIALCQEYWASSPAVKAATKRKHKFGYHNVENALTRAPSSHHWFLAFKYFFFRYITLLAFYSLPVLILFFLNIINSNFCFLFKN
ncbi:SLATT domain-containing protein [Marinomonas rhizomae]|uniref:SMODS and SLOG-associating 2TM effector domain-containing protein n=1 Tax=Marinomonas rhizomae TaxID=491948 RepID=A0A366J9J6_9GAMM|nr:SLATT domain-containing protein [Marinomonas rhizomae]RBP83049.1 hypothetical protein DFP80_10715 [Marinomonas rhizomae]